MSYPYPAPTPYMQAAMSQAVQAMMVGSPIPPGCLVMSMPYHQIQQMLPQLMMNTPMGVNDSLGYVQKPPYYNPNPFINAPPMRGPMPQPNYNYPMVPFQTNIKNNAKKSKKNNRHEPHSNVYNSSSFDSYMRHLSWSRLFDHPSKKPSKKQNVEGPAINNDKAPDAAKTQRTQSSSSTSSTTSDETIRRVNIANKQTTNVNPKQQTKGTLPFKYSSEFVPGLGKQQQQQQQQQPQPQQPQLQQPQQSMQHAKPADPTVVRKQ